MTDWFKPKLRQMDNTSREKELTLTAFVLGVLLAVVFGAANAYL